LSPPPRVCDAHPCDFHRLAPGHDTLAAVALASPARTSSSDHVLDRKAVGDHQPFRASGGPQPASTGIGHGRGTESPV
jgi:hypothetical protein